MERYECLTSSGCSHDITEWRKYLDVTIVQVRGKNMYEGNFFDFLPFTKI